MYQVAASTHLFSLTSKWRAGWGKHNDLWWHTAITTSQSQPLTKMVPNHYPCITEGQTFEIWSCEAWPYSTCWVPVHYNYGHKLSAAPAVLQVTCVFSINLGDVWVQWDTSPSACRLSACCPNRESLWGWKWQWTSPWQVPIMHRACGTLQSSCPKSPWWFFPAQLALSKLG